MKVKMYLAILISAILMLSSAAPVLALDEPVMVEKSDNFRSRRAESKEGIRCDSQSYRRRRCFL